MLSSAGGAGCVWLFLCPKEVEVGADLFPVRREKVSFSKFSPARLRVDGRVVVPCCVPKLPTCIAAGIGGVPAALRKGPDARVA